MKNGSGYRMPLKEPNNTAKYRNWGFVFNYLSKKHASIVFNDTILAPNQKNKL